MGGKSKKKSVVGYKYNIGLHFAICHGPIAKLQEIWWADKVAWSGTLNNPGDESQGLVAVDNTGLFGGDTSEGGVKGLVEIGFGGWGQRCIGVGSDGSYSAPAIVAWFLSKGYNWKPQVKVPDLGLNYRGLAVALMHDHYIGNNAYLKDVSFKVSCFWADWHPELCYIGDNMNPAHIIREGLVNTEWGLGYAPATIDDAAYLSAAQTLYNEGFGLSFVWDDDKDLYTFIDDVKSCINAVTYLDPRSGLWTIKLIRAGEPSALTINPDNASLKTFTRKALGETYNEISTKYTNPENEEYETVTVQDPANIEAQGRVVSTTKEYVGVRDANLAIRLTERDLQVASAQLCTAEVVMNREAWAIAPGMNVTFNWPRHGISNMIMRVDEVSIAAVGDDSISLRIVEDVFSRSSATFAGSQDNGWVDPAQPATLFPYRHTWEYPFWYLIRAAGLPADVLPTFAGFSTEIATGGNDNAQSVQLFSYITTEAGQSWQLVAVGPLTPKSALSDALVPEITSLMKLNTSASYRLADMETNSFALLTDGTNEEIVQVTNFADVAQQATITRGLMDTQPRNWPAGTIVYFIGSSTFPEDESVRSFGETAQYRPVMQTSIDQMDINNVPTDTITLRGRYELPYPVANVKIGGAYWPASVNVNGIDLAVTWANRNRLLQDAATQVPWDAGNIIPEDGTTVTIELWRSGSRVYQQQGITGTSFNIPVDAMSTGTYEIRIYTMRDGRRNYTNFQHTFNVVIPSRDSGYGNSYGFTYGA